MEIGVFSFVELMPDPVTGEPRKRRFGPWMLKAFGVLARFKFLRGTAFDPFGHSEERKLERELIAEYEATVDLLIKELKPSNYATAVALVIVGIYMIKHIVEIDFTDWDEGAPAFLMILLMPLTYSISNGLCFGILSYIAIQLATGKWRKITPVLVFIGALSLLYLILGAKE